jgi:hypothetical protein
MRAETAPVSHAIQAIIDQGDRVGAPGTITDAILEL